MLEGWQGVNCSATLQNCAAGSTEVPHVSPPRPCHSTARCVHLFCTKHQRMFMTACFFNSPKLEIMQISSDQTVGLLIMMRPYNRILLNNKKEQTIDTYNNIKSQRFYVG